MKFSLVFLAAVASSASAFAPSRFTRSPSALHMVDTSPAVQEALEASKKYGASSPEARAAWDIVEEMDASNRWVLEILVEIFLLASLC